MKETLSDIMNIFAVGLFIVSSAITTICGASLMIKLTMVYIGVGI